MLRPAFIRGVRLSRAASGLAGSSPLRLQAEATGIYATPKIIRNSSYVTAPMSADAGMVRSHAQTI
jgi:hypothetical protein